MKKIAGSFILVIMLVLVLNSCGSGQNTFVAIDSGYDRTCALTKAGGVMCWGNGTTTPTEIPGLTSGVKAISVGLNHICALTSNGEVKCWQENGNEDFGIAPQLAGPTPED